MKNKYFVSLGILILFSSVLSFQVTGGVTYQTEITSQPVINNATPYFENVVFITWDGANARALERHIDDGTLVNTKRVDQIGYRQTVRITSHLTSTGAGLACIESGYGPDINLIPYNMFGEGSLKLSMPDGMTIAEQLKASFGDDITTMFLFPWDTANVTYDHMAQLPSRDSIYDNMKAEIDYYFASENLSWTPGDPESIAAAFHTYDPDLGLYSSPVMKAGYLGNIAVGFLENNVTTDRFFLRMHLTEPDQAGHGYSVYDTYNGETTSEYLQSLVDCDIVVGQVLDVLENQGILDETLVIVGTDHGMYFRTHDSNPWPGKDTDITEMTYIISNNSIVGQHNIPVHQMDIAPTILDAMGVDTSLLSPAYDGGEQTGQLIREITDNTDPVINKAFYNFIGNPLEELTSSVKLTETFNLTLITYDWDNTLNGVLEVDDQLFESSDSKYNRVWFYNLDMTDVKSGKKTFSFTVTDSFGNSDTLELTTTVKVSAPVWLSIIGFLVIGSTYLIINRRKK
jgi:hypothetical protein